MLFVSRLMQYNQNIKPLTRKEYYVSQAVSLIENSYFKNISVQSISDAVGLERTYLYRIFKEITGVTIQEYLTDLKLKRARYFLTNSDFSCADIAYYCGYLSEQYFSMAFKKKTGLSPSLYRQKALSDRSFHAKGAYFSVCIIRGSSDERSPDLSQAYLQMPVYQHSGSYFPLLFLRYRHHR